MNKEIEALLIEREGYVRRGLKDRVQQVDAALAALGHKMSKKDDHVEVAAVDHAAETSSAPKRARRAAD